MPARFASIGLCVAAAFAGCVLQSGGLEQAGSSTFGASSSSSSSGGTGGHGGAQGTSSSSSSGHPGTGGADAGGHDAGPDAAPVDAAPVDAAPVDAGPTAYPSCLDWLTAHPGSGSGVYNLVDGMGNGYAAYCDMGGGGDAGDAGDVGGWTLALKIDGTNLGVLFYADPLWTNDLPLNAGMPDLDMNEAKLPSFWSVPLTALRVGMIDGGVLRWLVVPLTVPGPSTTLLDLTTSSSPPQTNLGRSTWEGLVANGSLQTSCKWEGINANGTVRIGIVGDESGDCGSPDSFVGFGAVPTSANRFEAPSPPSGNIAHYNPDNNDQSTTTFGYVMVR